jgi:hypothetical protein
MIKKCSPPFKVNDFSLEYVTHDDAVAAIASVVEQFNEIILRVGKVTEYTTQTIDDAEMKLVAFNQDLIFTIWLRNKIRKKKHKHAI